MRNRKLPTREVLAVYRQIGPEVLQILLTAVIGLVIAIDYLDESKKAVTTFRLFVATFIALNAGWMIWRKIRDAKPPERAPEAWDVLCRTAKTLLDSDNCSGVRITVCCRARNLLLVGEHYFQAVPYNGGLDGSTEEEVGGPGIPLAWGIVGDAFTKNAFEITTATLERDSDEAMFEAYENVWKFPPEEAKKRTRGVRSWGVFPVTPSGGNRKLATVFYVDSTKTGFFDDESVLDIISLLTIELARCAGESPELSRRSLKIQEAKRNEEAN